MHHIRMKGLKPLPWVFVMLLLVFFQLLLLPRTIYRHASWIKQNFMEWKAGMEEERKRKNLESPKYKSCRSQYNLNFKIQSPTPVVLNLDHPSPIPRKIEAKKHIILSTTSTSSNNYQSNPDDTILNISTSSSIFLPGTPSTHTSTPIRPMNNPLLQVVTQRNHILWNNVIDPMDARTSFSLLV